MNCLFWSPSLTMTFMMALRSITSEPARCRMWSEAKRVRSMRRGSATMRFAPCFATAALMRRAMIGCASVVLDPITKIQSACSSSALELVIAPEPKAAARPATEGLCHKWAQWATWLLPTAIRMNFWKT